MKLLDVITGTCYNYTGTLRKDRVNGNPKLTPVHLFKKKPRGYSETITLQDKSATVVRWNDNAPVTMVSSLLGNLPESNDSRVSTFTTLIIPIYLIIDWFPVQ